MFSIFKKKKPSMPTDIIMLSPYGVISNSLSDIIDIEYAKEDLPKEITDKLISFMQRFNVAIIVHEGKLIWTKYIYK